MKVKLLLGTLLVLGTTLSFAGADKFRIVDAECAKVNGSRIIEYVDLDFCRQAGEMKLFWDGNECVEIVKSSSMQVAIYPSKVCAEKFGWRAWGGSQKCAAVTPVEYYTIKESIDPAFCAEGSKKQYSYPF